VSGSLHAEINYAARETSSSGAEAGRSLGTAAAQVTTDATGGSDSRQPAAETVAVTDIIHPLARDTIHDISDVEPMQLHSNVDVSAVTAVLNAEKHTDGGNVTALVTNTSQHLVKSQATENTVTASPSATANCSAADSAAAVKSKSELRAERRAIQEAQRAAKAAKQLGGQKESAPKPVKPVEAKPTLVPDKKASTPKVVSSGSAQVKKQPDQATTPGPTAAKDSKVRVSDKMQADDDRIVKRQSRKLEKQNVPRRQSTNQKKVSLFRHLVQYERNVKLTHQLGFNSSTIHPAVLQLGTKYMEGVISGSNARCIALLMVMKKVIADYRTPENKELSRDLEVHIRPYISFLNECRPMSVSMGNAVKYLKHQITHSSSSQSDDKARESLQSDIDRFIQNVKLAMQAISIDACRKIQNGDTLLVYSCSSLLVKVLCDAQRQGTKFRVIVADGRPKLDGRRMLHRLVQNGICCTYILINAVSYVMKEVTKVLLGAHALLANGSVMSRVGCSQIALTAKVYNIPVLVCCETYKFCERVQTDSFVFNELGDPCDVMTVNGVTNNSMLTTWQNNSVFHVLNLVYDVTPPDLVSMVITELGMIPCTSVPVVLRVKFAESNV
jgi:translation initiation factor eIF-2B subunit delta